MLRAYARAFAAVGTSSGNVERADYVIKLLLETVVVRLCRYAGLGIVEYAFDACTRRAGVSARVATYAARQFAFPESISFVGGHPLEFADLGKSVVGSFAHFVKNDPFVGGHEFLTLAGKAFFKQNFAFFGGFNTVGRSEFYRFAVVFFFRLRRQYLCFRA